jgi:hypothetical protein
MLSNELFALGCLAYYEEEGLIVDSTNGEFAHCPYPESMGDTGYYLLHEHHQHQGLLQSRDVGRICFFPGDAKRWLKQSSTWPENYLDLWGIYEEFTSKQSRENGRKGVKALHAHPNTQAARVRNGQKTAESNFSPHRSENGRRVAKLTLERKLGIHDPEYRTSEEYLSMRSRESKKLVEGQVGMFHPDFIRRQNEKMSRPTVFVYPDGEEVSYSSRSEAIKATGISSSTMVRVLGNGKAIRCGKFKGVRLREV